MSARPAWAGEYGPSYREVVGSWGLSIDAFETFGSYQGDHLALVRGPAGVGLIVFGYGSCSGCDELQDISPWDDDEDSDWQPVIDFAERLRSSIHWEPTREAMRDWVDQSPENNWWSYEDEIAAYLNQTLGTSLAVDAS